MSEIKDAIIENMATDIRPLIASQIHLKKCEYALEENQIKYNGMCWEADFDEIAKLLFEAGYRKSDLLIIAVDKNKKSVEELKEIASKFIGILSDSKIIGETHMSDKETPMAVTHEVTLYEACTCPRCKNVVSKFEEWGNRKVRILYQYCPYCGQHLKGDDEK